VYAVERARWSEVIQWRQAVVVSERVGDGEMLAQTLLAPQQIMRICELLGQEGRLTRRFASQFEEVVLAWVSAHGNWK
jgi:hypothetical protein